MRRRRPALVSPDTAESSQPRQEPLLPSAVAMAGPHSVRDRTQEFAAVLEAARAAGGRGGGGKAFGGVGARAGAQGPAGPGQAGAAAAARRSDFARLAARVGADIAGTSTKLAALTQLAQRRSLFDDPTTEIQELTYVIKQDLGALNARLEDLQRLRDATRRSSNKQTGDHSESVVDSLKSRLGATAEGFKSVLKMRTESLAAQQGRREQFMGPSGNTAAHVFPGPAARSSTAPVAIDLGGGSLGAGGASTSRGGLGGAHADGQSLMLMRPPQDLSYQQARADAVRQVESTIVELGSIFNQLATMVSEQGELVERIDANVDETVSNVDAGHNQLMIYYNSISGNRALILKVFAVLLVFLILWTVIV
jgi:syntaxin 5